jgi:hypothetical protein
MIDFDGYRDDGCVAKAESVRRQLKAEQRQYREEEREIAEKIPRRSSYESQIRRAVEIRRRREWAVALAARELSSIPDHYQELNGDWTEFQEWLTDVQCGGNYPAAPFSRPFNLRDLGWLPTWKPPSADCPYRRQSVHDVEAEFARGKVLTEEELSEYGLTIRDLSREYLLAMIDREMFVPSDAYQTFHHIGGRFWLCRVATHTDGRPWGVSPVRWARAAQGRRERA